ncbi:MAG: collagen binding domain-containing protein [Blastocatellales bacterium]
MRLLLILLIPLLTPNIPAQNPVKGTSIVAGKVTLKKEPAKGVTIGLFDKSLVERNPNAPGLRVKSQPDGTFRFTEVPAGVYYLTVFAPGFVVPGDANFWPVGRSKVVNVAEGESIDDLDLELQPGGVITGRVTDASGRPLVDTMVDLLNLDQNGRQVPVRSGWNPYLNMTDDRGIYRVYGLPAGKYVASVGFESKTGSITFTMNRTYYPKTYHPDVSEIEKARILELKEGDEITGVDIVVGEIKRTYDVLGRVIDDQTGRPLAGVQVSYGQYDTQAGMVTTWGSGDVVTDGDGKFKFNGVLPGSYGAFAQPNHNSEFYSDVRPFLIRDADVESLELRATRGMTVAGKVILDASVDPAGIASAGKLRVFAGTLRENAGPPPVSVMSEVMPDMTFMLKGMQPGKNLIQVMPANSEVRLAVTRIEKDGAVTQDNRIDIASGEQIRNLNVYLTIGSGVIKGRIVIVGGSLPRGLILGAWIKKDGQGGFVNTAVDVDSRGNFVFKNLPPGDYEVRLSCRFAGRGDPSPEIRYIIDKFSGVMERVRTGYGSEATVTMTVDLR